MNERIQHLIDDRKLTLEQIERFHIKYDPSIQAVSIPINNEYGQYVGRIDYHPKATPKYVKNLKETHRPVFFNAQSLRKVFYGKPIFITEGVFDALSFDRQGVVALALLGASLNRKDLEVLTRYTDKIILALDNDTAGFIATEKIIKDHESFKFYKFRLQGAKDANDLIRTDPDSFERQVREFLSKFGTKA